MKRLLIPVLFTRVACESWPAGQPFHRLGDLGVVPEDWRACLAIFLLLTASSSGAPSRAKVGWLVVNKNPVSRKQPQFYGHFGGMSHLEKDNNHRGETAAYWRGVSYQSHCTSYRKIYIYLYLYIFFSGKVLRKGVVQPHCLLWNNKEHSTSITQPLARNRSTGQA